ncbi:MAG: hypothetical protein ACHQ01_00490 [Candidatus Limnocylindrales bacterium]
MNEHLPPIDSAIREHLARRSAGGLPEGLLTGVAAALDGVQEPRAGLRWPRVVRHPPRLAAAGVVVLLVAIVAIALALPAFNPGPAASNGYPAGRPLTTAELASLMAGPPLAINSAVVASVTIDARTDVCPMNRYSTVGVVESMPSQVCVMGATLAAQLPGPTATGTFAFRYLAPGYLGLLGQITPASTGYAFKVADDWPVGGKTFVVEGWLGATELTVSCASVPAAGDALNPNGDDCPYDDWFADSQVDASMAAQNESGSSERAGSSSPLLPVPQRHVEAGGVHQIDGVPWSPGGIHGVYVVRGVTEQCPNTSPQDNRGCTAWRVLAQVADISMPAPSASAAVTQTPTTGPPATPIVAPTSTLPIAPTGLIGPGNRALTDAELSALEKLDPHYLVGRYLIHEQLIGGPCTGCSGSGQQNVAYAEIVPATLLGPLTARSDGGLVWTVPDAKAAATASGQPYLFVLDAWITGMGADACDVAGAPCYEVSWLGSEPGGHEMDAQLGAYHEFGGGPVGGGESIHGLFLFRWEPGGHCSGGMDTGPDTCTPHAVILARLEPAVLP